MMKQFLFLLLLSSVTTGALQADSYLSYESGMDVKLAETRILQMLTNLDPEKYSSKDETQGFSFLLSSTITSPFSYNIYGGRVSAQLPKTIIRMEGGTGDVNIMARILEMEKVISYTQSRLPGQKPRKVLEKSHLISQSINFLAPWGAVLYNSYNSPRLTRRQTTIRFLMYFALDIVAAYMGGSNFFQEGFNPSEHGGKMAALMLMVRAAGAVQTYNLTSGHNKLAGLKYTFFY